MNSDLEAISLSVPSLCQPLDMMGGNAESSSGAGTLWQDPSICKSANPGVISLPSDTLLTTGKCKNRAVTVAYVRNSETSQHLSPENMALQCLKDACDVVGCKLDVVPFGKLDFGETAVLDHFYNAGKSTESPAKPFAKSTQSLLTAQMCGLHSVFGFFPSLWFLSCFPALTFSRKVLRMK